MLRRIAESVLLVWTHVTIAAFAIGLGTSALDHPHTCNKPRALGPGPRQITSLVTFGDSYTDVVTTTHGGTAWPVYAAGYAHLALHPFARYGQTCSSNQTHLIFGTLFDDQMPLYFDEVNNGSLKLDPAATLYTLWIGTNDVGNYALLTGMQTPGVTIVDLVDCALSWITVLYKSGARNFLFQNMIPLQNLILYQVDSYPNHYWTGPRDGKQWNDEMTQLVAAWNSISELKLRELARTLRGAHIGLFDAHGLFTDIINDPKRYLNGTTTPNVTGAIQECVLMEGEDISHPGNCTVVTGTDRDSYLWFDELHPSEQADRVVARAVADGIRRKSTQNWVTWLS